MPAYPADMIGIDRWVRWQLIDGRKVPLQVSGRYASSTDSGTWSSYREASRAKVGDGLGFVLDGDGFGCFDLDDVLVDGDLLPAARKFLDEHESWLVEISPSGKGLHVWVYADSQAGWVRDIDGIKVEFYTRGRYMTMTGVKFQQ
ncbi:DNA primase [Gulosibacter macacae]|uniref:DNA primase n=1 Tax=Gulosibacter macacae TaxID=2488791 RepID=A0A3P3VTY7_9MICO|nr:DNA primase [Gulosibacter macacae]RRJ85914.1 DNA primase [Gulosibacter macacae]